MPPAPAPLVCSSNGAPSSKLNPANAQPPANSNAKPSTLTAGRKRLNKVSSRSDLKMRQPSKAKTTGNK